MSNLADAAVSSQFRIGPYQILDTIGSGGMGVVYRALDSQLRRVVALKVLHDDLRNNPSVVTRFRREAQAAAALQHPNIVPAYAVEEIDGIPCIAMAYIDGVPLNRVLSLRAPLSWREAFEYGRQTADALHSAHAAGLIHRDIKPANLLIGNSGQVYVTDFGIAKVLHATKQLTIDSRRLGTPDYMAPEIYREQRVVPASDLYSLGVVLFQCITGYLPHGQSRPSIEEAIATPFENRRITDHIGDVPEDVDRLVAYLLEQDPRQRPGSAMEAAAALERVLAGEPLDIRDQSVATALRGFRETVERDADSDDVAPALHGTKRRSASTSETAHEMGLRSGLVQGLAALLVAAAIAAGLVWTKPAPQSDAVGTLDPQAHQGHWFDNTPLVRIDPESTGVWRATLGLSGFDVVGVRSDGRGVFAALLRNERSQAQAAIRFDADFAESAFEVAIPAGRVATEPWTIHGFDPSATGALILEGAGSFRSFDPSTRTSLVVGAPGPLRTMPDLVARAETLALSAQGTHVAWHDEDGKVYLARRSGSDSHTEPLLEAGGTLHHQACHPSANLLLASEAVADADPELVVFDSADAVVVARPGAGRLAAWGPDGASILALAEDRAGSMQLWQIEPSTPHRRRQLTYVAGGLSGMYAVDHSTGTAVAALDGAPELLLIQLPSDVPF